jgi:hypothetical protein
LEETALAFLEEAYNNAETLEIEGQQQLVFRGSDAANALGLTMAGGGAPRGRSLP